MRKAAENWRNGLAAIIGLIAALSVIKGPSEVSGLEHLVAYAVGGALLLALACAGFGVWMSLIAAYGIPTVLTREYFREIGGINGHRLALATQAASKLHAARVATIATVVLLALAVGLTWYGPRPTSVTLNVERRSLPNACGKLLSSANGSIDISPTASQSIRVTMAEVVKLTPVEACP